MLEFSDAPIRDAAPPPPSSYTPTDADALGLALRRAAVALAGRDPSYGETLFALSDLVAPAEPESPAVDAFLDAVGAYVRALRARGTSPEQVVIAVKRHLQVSFGAAADPGRVSAWLAHAVTWGIEAYYRDD